MPKFRRKPQHNTNRGSRVIKKRLAWFMFLCIVGGMGALVYWLRGILLPFILAILIAFVLEPMVTRLEGLGLRRFAGVLLVYLTLILSIVVFSRFLVPILETESTKVLAAVNQFVKSAPNLYEKLEKGVGDFVESVTSGGELSGPESGGRTMPTEDWGFGPNLDRFKAAANPAVPHLSQVNLDAGQEAMAGVGIKRQPLLAAAASEEQEAPTHTLTVEPTQNGQWGIRLNQASFEVHKSGEGVINVVADTRISKASKLTDVKNQITDAMRGGLESMGTSLLSGFFTFFQGLVKGIIGALFGVFIVFMVAAFIMIDAPKIKKSSRNLVPDRFREDYDEFVSSLNTGLAGVVRGQLLICLINGILSGIGFAIFIPEYAVVLAIFSGTMSLIPIFGTILSSVPAILIGLTIGFSHALGILAWILGIHFIEANILNPKIIGTQAEIHPALVIFALIAGEYMFGIKGALLAVPITSLLLTIIHFTYSRTKRHLV